MENNQVSFTQQLPKIGSVDRETAYAGDHSCFLRAQPHHGDGLYRVEFRMQQNIAQKCWRIDRQNENRSKNRREISSGANYRSKVRFERPSIANYRANFRAE